MRIKAYLNLHSLGSTLHCGHFKNTSENIQTYFTLKPKGQTEHIQDLGDMSCPVSWFLKLYFYREWIRKKFKLVRYEGVILSHQSTRGETFKNYKFLENIKNPLGLARKMSASQKRLDGYWPVSWRQSCKPRWNNAFPPCVEGTNDTNPF